MKKRKRVLIVSVDRHLPMENFELIRRKVMKQVNEGVVVLPPWLIGTVTDLDICGGEKDE